MICAECRTEIEAHSVICPGCGARVGKDRAMREQADWREQVRETVERHKEKKRRKLAERDDDARQLSIFPDVRDENPELRAERLRRAEIRQRVEQRVGKRQSTPSARRRLAVGELPLRSGAAAAAARELRHDEEAEPATTRDARVGSVPDEIDFELEANLSEKIPSRDDGAGPAEGSSLEFGLASVGTRLLSAAIDMVFVVCIQLTLFYLTTHLVAQRMGALPNSALAAMGVVGGVLAAGYFLFFWALSGQTLGKLLTGARVVDRRGRALGFGRAAARLAGAVLAVLPLGAGFIGLWSDPARRGWHDRIAGTKVVRG